jgi:hypothetical protein
MSSLPPPQKQPGFGLEVLLAVIIWVAIALLYWSARGWGAPAPLNPRTRPQHVATVQGVWLMTWGKGQAEAVFDPYGCWGSDGATAICGSYRCEWYGITWLGYWRYADGRLFVHMYDPERLLLPLSCDSEWTAQLKPGTLTGTTDSGAVFRLDPLPKGWQP